MGVEMGGTEHLVRSMQYGHEVHVRSSWLYPESITLSVPLSDKNTICLSWQNPSCVCALKDPLHPLGPLGPECVSEWFSAAFKPHDCSGPTPLSMIFMLHPYPRASCGQATRVFPPKYRH